MLLTLYRWSMCEGKAQSAVREYITEGLVTIQGIQGRRTFQGRTEAWIGGEENYRHWYNILGSEKKTDAWREMTKRKVVWDLTGEVGWDQIRQGFGARLRISIHYKLMIINLKKLSKTWPAITPLLFFTETTFLNLHFSRWSNPYFSEKTKSSE